MTISESHVVDEMAQNVFRSGLPPSWLKREQKPDHHIDYFVEIAEEGAIPSGITFAVQLKGTKSPRYSDNFIVQSMKVEHLAYYIDKVRRPVFLIVIDVQSSDAYWLFMQEWIISNLKDPKWRKQQKVSVKIPLANQLQETSKLQKSVIEAEKYMRDLWPSSIPAAVSAEQKKLETLDNRFVVDISYAGGEVHYDLQPRSSINFTLQIKNQDTDKLRSKMIDLFERGLKVKFQPGEIEIQGSKLLSAIAADPNLRHIELHSAVVAGAELLLLSTDSSGAECVRLSFHGKVSLGSSEGNFDGHLKNSPLGINLAFPLDFTQSKPSFDVSFNFNTSVWEGLPLLRLPYFDRVLSFFKSLQSGNSLRMVFEVEGYHIFSGTSTSDMTSGFLSGSMKYLELMEKARLVAQRIGINPLTPRADSIPEQDFETISLLSRLIEQGEHRQSGEGARFNGRLKPNETFFAVLEGNHDYSKAFTFEPEGQVFSFFGVEFVVNWLRYTLTRAKLIIDSSLDHANKEEIMKHDIDIEWVGSEGAELIISNIQSK